MPTTDPMRHFMFRAFAFSLAAALIAGVSVAAYRDASREPPLVTTHLAALALKDTQGSTFDQSALAGKPVAVFFGFTRCPDVCPMTLQRLARMREKFGSPFDQIEVIFVTLDPSRDTASLLKDYMAAQPLRVTGLTGSLNEIARTAEHFGVYREQVVTSESDYTIDHTASIFLIGKDGQRAGEIPIDATESEFESKLRGIL